MPDIDKAIERLEAEFLVIKNNLDSAKRLNSRIDISSLTHQDYQLMLNNERFSLDTLTFMVMVIYKDKKLGMKERNKAIRNFAAQGEELSGKIMDYICSNFPEHYIVFLIDSTDIADKLLMRRMPQQEYEGYLNGKLPFAKFDGKEYYLPASQS